MEDMLELFFAVLVLGVSLLAKIMKKQKNAQAKAMYEASFPEKKPASAKAEHPYTPAQPTILPPVTASDIPGQVIAPTVHTHVQPDCETHDAPSGSLYVTTDEGKDPCHEPQLTHARSNQEPAEQEEGSLTFDWSGENMVKAFVMQEILTRPASRTPVCPRQAR